MLQSTYEIRKMGKDSMWGGGECTEYSVQLCVLAALILSVLIYGEIHNQGRYELRLFEFWRLHLKSLISPPSL